MDDIFRFKMGNLQVKYDASVLYKEYRYLKILFQLIFCIYLI